jgi:hypothetical protein
LIERLDEPAFFKTLSGKDYVARERAINYAKLRIMRALALLAKAIHAPFVLPKSFIQGYFWEEGDIDKMLEEAMYPQQEKLLRTWATSNFDA